MLREGERRYIEVRTYNPVIYNKEVTMSDDTLIATYTCTGT